MTDETKRSEFREKLNGYVNIYSFMSQIMPYGDPALEMLFSYGRFLVPHLPLDRDTERVKLGDEVGLQYYRLARIYSGEILLSEGEPEGVKSPTDVGTGKAKDEKVPLSEIIKVLNERFGTNFTDEDRFFEQIGRPRQRTGRQAPARKPVRQVSTRSAPAHREHDGPTHGRQRQDRDPLHGRQGVWRRCFRCLVKIDLRLDSVRRGIRQTMTAG